MTSSESQLEQELIAKLPDLRYVHRPNLRDRAALEANQPAIIFCPGATAFDRRLLHFSTGVHTRLLDEIITQDAGIDSV